MARRVSQAACTTPASDRVPRRRCASTSTRHAGSSSWRGSPSPNTASAQTADEAREAAEEIGGPVVIKSQVLTGGRMKAGGVKFADTPDEAAEHAAAILELEIGGHMPRGVLVDPKAEVKQEYYAGVVWDGTAKKPLMLFSDMGGIDIEEVAETHPDHVGRGHVSNLLPVSDFEAKQVVAAHRRHRLAAQPRDPDPRPPRPPLPRERHDAGRDQPAGRARGRQLRRARRPHGDGERGGRAARRACCASSWRSPRTTPARPTSPPTSSATSALSTPPTTAA